MTTPFFNAPENPTGVTAGRFDSHRRPWSQSASRRALAAAGVVGATLEVARGLGLNGLAGSIAIAVSVAALAWIVRPAGASLIWVGFALAFVPWFSLRSSGWLIGPNAIAVGALLALLAGGRDGLATSFSQLGRRMISVVPAVLLMPRELHLAGRAAFPTSSVERRIARLRGATLAVLLAFVLLALLLSGDQFFASLIGIEDAGNWVSRVVGAAAGAVMFFVLVARNRMDAGKAEVPRAVVGPSEALIVLGVLVLVLAAYVSSTIVAALAGRSYVERRTGLTYSEYARSGFFQLVGVVVVVVGVLVTLRPTFHDAGRADRADGTQDSADRCDRPRRWIVMALGAIGLTIAVVCVCISRLQTYRSVYGLTMLRLSTTVFAAWLGLVLVLVGTSFASKRRRHLLVHAVFASGLVVLLAFNMTNPEAFVVRENIDRVSRVQAVVPDSFDGLYLAEGLGIDAIPTLLDRLDRLDDSDRRVLVDRVCSRRLHPRAQSWNRSVAAPHRAFTRTCARAPAGAS